MSLPHQAVSQRRTSERRRLKLLRKSDEYRVSNPFRHPRAPPFPQALAQQLKRIEFLSLSTIAQICFDANPHENDCPEGVLARMHEAVHLQELKYSSILGETCPLGEPMSPAQQEEDKVQPQEEVVQTKDEVSLNIFSIFDPRDPRREQEFGCETPQPNQVPAGVQVSILSSVGPAVCGGGPMLAQQQYQNYFAQ